VRDRRSVLILLFLPVFFLFLYGYALNFDIRHVALAVQDRDDSVESRQLVAAFTRSTYFDLVANVYSEGQIEDVMNRGAARAALVIPEGVGGDVRRRALTEVQVILNGDNANTATTVLGYTNAVLSQASVTLGAAPRARMIGVEPRVWYNPELRSTLF